jgi:dihydrofolate reductase
MRKLVVNTFLTVDGVMQAPGGPDEDPTGGFTHGGWSSGYWDEQMNQKMAEWMSEPMAMLLGRKTYQIFASYWPYSNEEELAAPLNNATKYVASRTLESVEWENSELLRGDLAKAISQLKKEDGPEIRVFGSSNLIQSLLKHDLIDEFRLWAFPLVLGGGKRLFEDGTEPAGLRSLDSWTSKSGVVLTTYATGEEIPAGSLTGLDEAGAERHREALRRIWEPETTPRRGRAAKATV